MSTPAKAQEMIAHHRLVSHWLSVFRAVFSKGFTGASINDSLSPEVSPNSPPPESNHVHRAQPPLDLNPYLLWSLAITPALYLSWILYAYILNIGMRKWQRNTLAPFFLKHSFWAYYLSTKHRRGSITRLSCLLSKQ